MKTPILTHPELRILIVEDELIIAHHIAEVLNSKGFENTRIVKTLDDARHESPWLSGLQKY